MYGSINLSGMDALVLKVKTKAGDFIVTGLTQNNNVWDLKVQLSETCKIPMSDLYVLVGFPPKPINLSENSSTLSSIGVNSGDTLIVEQRKPQVFSVMNDEFVPSSKENYSQMYLEPFNHRGLLMRKIVPADNSCLFTSIGFTLTGIIDPACVPFMRHLIAEHVALDQETYSEAILGNKTEDYCEWIMKPDSWGGAIELSILSGYYGIEMDVVDTVNAIINRFGEDKNYSHRIFLLFDGIHYDPLYAEVDGGGIQTVFPLSDEAILEDASILAQEAKSSRQYTDVNKFCLRCLTCQAILIGQTEAAQHAKTTGHTSFGEIDDKTNS